MLDNVTLPSEPAQLTTWALIAAGHLLAAAALSARYLPLLKALVQRLPAAYRWIPMAVGAASLPLQTSLPKAQNAQDVVEAVIVAAVAAWAAYEAGGKAPDHDDTPSGVGGSTTVLLVLLVLGLGGMALGVSGCAVVQGPCSAKSRSVTCVSAAAAVAVDQCEQDATTLDIEVCLPAIAAYKACLESSESACQR